MTSRQLVAQTLVCVVWTLQARALAPEIIAERPPKLARASEGRSSRVPLLFS
jgi:hypothetical protein